MKLFAKLMCLLGWHRVLPFDEDEKFIHFECADCGAYVRHRRYPQPGEKWW